METLISLSGQNLKWSQPHMTKMEYELGIDGKVAAVLRFRSSFGSMATAETASGSWTFKRVGFFQTKVTVRESGSDVDAAVFKNNTWNNGGSLEFLDGRTYLASTNFWATEYEFKTEAGETLVRFRKIGGVLHASAEVEILTASAGLQGLPILVTLGWYLAILMQQDAAATSVVIAGS